MCKAELSPSTDSTPHTSFLPLTHIFDLSSCQRKTERLLLCFPCCRSLNSTSLGSSPGFSQNNSEVSYLIVNCFEQINQPFFRLHITLSVNGQCNHINKECWRTDRSSSIFSGFIYKVPIINMTGIPTFTFLVGSCFPAWPEKSWFWGMQCLQSGFCTFKWIHCKSPRANR